jgi:hypothetical protein
MTKENAIISHKSFNIPQIVEHSNTKAHHPPPSTYPSAPLYSASLLNSVSNSPLPDSPGPLQCADLTHPRSTSTAQPHRAHHTPGPPLPQHAFQLPHQHLGHFLNLLTERIDLLVRDAFHFRKCVFHKSVEVDAVIGEGLGECDVSKGGGGFGGGFGGGGEDGFEVGVDVGGEEGGDFVRIGGRWRQV